jgi:hypothetical protein
MKLVTMLAVLCLATLSFAQTNTLTDQEKSDGWTLLFDGKTLDGWTTSADKSAWTIEQDKDGAVLTMAKPGKGWWLRTPKMYRDFELFVDFDVAKGKNSGVGLRGSSVGDPAFTGMEIQIFGNQGEEPTITSCGSVYDAIAPAAMPLKDGGQWNTYHIKLVGDTLNIWLNGEQIQKDQKLDTRGYFRKPEDKRPLNARCPTGFIALQDHGDKVRFRNIKIKDLSVDKDPGGFEAIFNGKDTKGWSTRAGAGKWRIEDGVLVGNESGLATDAMHENFEVRAFARSVPHGQGAIGILAGDKPVDLVSIASEGAWVDYRIRVAGGKVEAWKNGQALAPLSAAIASEAHVFLRSVQGDVMFKDVQVRELTPASNK